MLKKNIKNTNDFILLETFIVSTSKTNTKPGMMLHAYNPSTWEAEAG
jgi:hypothetical protein